MTLVFYGSYGQSVKDNGQLIFSIGPSFPLGQYANKNITGEKSGIASTGGVFNISYQSPLNNKIGFSASLLGQINPIDRHSMAKSFSQFGFPSYFGWAGTSMPPSPQPMPTIKYPNWSFKRSSWKLASLLMGGYSEFKTRSKKINITAKAIVGLAYAFSPKIDGTSITDTSYMHVTQSSESGLGIGYSIHAGLKFKLNAKLSFITGIEYLGTSNITFKNVVARITVIKHPNDPATMSASQMQLTANGKQEISSINAFAGIAMEL